MVEPEIKAVQPILAVASVPKALAYYQERLGAQNPWTWGDGPEHGGIQLGANRIQFSRNPPLAARAAGRELFFVVEGLYELFDRFQKQGANIVSDLDEKPWGMTEFMVADLDGYHLRFAGQPERVLPNRGTLPTDFEIVHRLPTPVEFETIKETIGWNWLNTDDVVAVLAETKFSVVAMGDGIAIGHARIIGDGLLFFYLEDVMVMPQYQNCGVGSAMVRALLEAIREQAAKSAFVTLFCTKQNQDYYRRFGFVGPEDGPVGMTLQISRL